MLWWDTSSHPIPGGDPITSRYWGLPFCRHFPMHFLKIKYLYFDLWNLLLIEVQLTTNQHWFRQWVGIKQVKSHILSTLFTETIWGHNDSIMLCGWWSNYCYECNRIKKKLKCWLNRPQHIYINLYHVRTKLFQANYVNTIYCWCPVMFRKENQQN